MNKTLELSIFAHGEEATAVLQELLTQFAAKTGIGVNLQVLDWSGDWARTLATALYNEGPDISEVGNTWIGDLTRMNALRPFSSAEIARFVPHKFLQSSWECGVTSDPSQMVYGIPWMAESRVLFYKKDVLAAAGITMPEKFESFSQFESKFRAMQEAGIAHPLVIPTGRSRICLHTCAIFVWGENGNFLDSKAGTLLFTEPGALRGFSDYFRLGKFISKPMHRLFDFQSDEQFWNGPAASTISGPWMLADNRISPEQKANWGAAQLPGVPFVGGFHLVIWKHTRQGQNAVRLVEYLTSHEVMRQLCPLFGLPARRETLQEAQQDADDKLRMVAHSLEGGRAFSAGGLWGLVENRLVDTIPLIWNEILEGVEDHDIPAVVEKHLVPVARRLQVALKV